MPRKDARVDAYIAKAKPFAQPVLKHLRSVVHEACPEVEETIKWGHASFDYKGMLCSMAAFKEYVTFGFWKHQLLVDRLPDAKNPMNQFGKVESVKDLPSRAALIRTVQAAMDLNEHGVKVQRVIRKKPPVKVPAYFTAALRKNAKALAAFNAFPPSHKREYVDWIVEAKREETRTRRVETAVGWIAQGKGRNWKYEN